jgi:hypothetical protein
MDFRKRTNYLFFIILLWLVAAAFLYLLIIKLKMLFQ